MSSLRVGVSFSEKLKEAGLFPLNARGIEVLQINVGKMCNQTCKHCHVDAGPTRKEIMSKQTMAKILDIAKSSEIKCLDLTGGAPELNPHFRWFVEEVRAQFGLTKEILVRCNLTIILSNPSFYDLPLFFKKNRIHIVSSLPHFSAGFTNRQRGDGVFEQSIKALKMLNEVGYGQADSGLKLDLVYNPSGAFLPAAQRGLEEQYKLHLKKEFGIHFNSLFTITNMPIARYLDWLRQSGNEEAYMQKLVMAFNPVAAKEVMCRNMVSVGWDGFLYDCDFNQMLEIKLKDIPTLDAWDDGKIKSRKILLGDHCFGCTAGAGSSCGGALDSEV